MTLAARVTSILQNFGVPADRISGAGRAVHSPLTGAVIGHVADATATEVDVAIAAAEQAFHAWREVPAPRRGELVRLIGAELRAAKSDLGALVTIEAGKIASEGQGEVQEMIDICDFAVGLSRQLHGLTIASERPNHRMMEQWHPLGPVGIITAFNFPVAVWAWNAALALVCGDPVIWKPSEKTPLTALAVQALVDRALKQFGDAPKGLSAVLTGGREVGERLVDDARVPLVSATGSTAMGRVVGPRLAQRFGRAILELGGNNAAIVCPSADLDLALRAITFAAVGTAGQRCTTLRRLFVHRGVHTALLDKLKRVYAGLPIGNPLDNARVLIGPLIDGDAFSRMQGALARARQSGGTVTGGARVAGDLGAEAYYVTPALVEMPQQTGPVLDETFAPILYVMPYDDLGEAVRLHNAVRQGLSSSIFTSDLREAEAFVAAAGSDCGIANVNIGPSGAEIGGAFGGEKDTGGGREAGSDAWKAYMRRQTSTVNYGRDLPLAQGVTFDIG
ncbi:aldehyde dehydrogenase family protein [Bradyrhizobium sp. U87765 SZCCT0131]|uniref:L-piperidine-6-carboxylate dehydrogenase n=1 Tax=unclassified Bradyrhizobium TaxID=2631580 RepID=UPI001BAAB55D|nr:MULTISPECIES: aldehyde dehydrogenase family protein [unclassified Bradyrhizobium]MBR1218937.1 aldehyde dehydrogenase family protein [Bradyrhizobium sp. U87765 SZCCT0131]MBR1261588.1 aldehyde dehydrogenase family protein [Bradyrhizobium sp. U87765 SZCCT0134]MBR1306559.1 aldehyde dehydrogenase family protein [Bradyrhizobium sp. U87765 SZCCT0110]MBR1317370.1 aldehyde dehydrogenase family protein [Bradyrhizobium sp. U87765 SZCCT0109]MBR1351072.1 aldehyde dehydrogenase family protein [Bradyrhizo